MTNLMSFFDDRPFATFNSLNSLLNDAQRAAPTTIAPAVDIEETAEHYLLSFDLPGFEKQDLDIEVEGERLTVTGERRKEADAGDRKLRFNERRFGRFQRSFTLPEGIQAEHLEAKYNNGVLSVAVPKAKAAQKTKIRIGEGKPSLLKTLLHKDKSDEKAS